MSLGNNGRIASQGTVTSAKDKGIAEEAGDETEVDNIDDVDEDYKVGEDGDGDNKAKFKDGKLVIAEEIQLGHVNRKSCTFYN